MDYRDMGMKIRTLRRKKGLRLNELAALLGLSPSFLGNIERGIRAASIETLATLCNTLKVSPSHLLESALTGKALPQALTDAEKEGI